MTLKSIRRSLFIIGTGLCALCAPALKSEAQVNQFGAPTYLTTPINSFQITGSYLQSTPFPVFIPPIQLSFSGATNPFTTVTNVITQTVTFTNTITFVYNAGIYGTNFTTNWSGAYYQVTNNTVGWAFPQSGGSNTCSVR